MLIEIYDDAATVGRRPSRADPVQFLVSASRALRWDTSTSFPRSGVEVEPEVWDVYDAGTGADSPPESGEHPALWFHVGVPAIPEGAEIPLPAYPIAALAALYRGTSSTEGLRRVDFVLPLEQLPVRSPGQPPSRLAEELISAGTGDPAAEHVTLTLSSGIPDVFSPGFLEALQDGFATTQLGALSRIRQVETSQRVVIPYSDASWNGPTQCQITVDALLNSASLPLLGWAAGYIADLATQWMHDRAPLIVTWSFQ